MVAHWLGLDREHGNSTTPLLVGDQGCGKSTYCLNILPPELRQFYTDSIDFSKRRDTELALHRYALVNIDEFDSVKDTHQSYLKHILQKAVVNTRLPYQSASRNLRRYATFIATSNNYDLLTDPTGSRRFICVEVKGRIDYAQPIDYDQLYAEAKELLRRGERFWFTPEEEALITENNRDFQQQPAEEQLFLRYFKIAEDIEEAKPLLASEILDMIAEKQPGFNITKTMIFNFGKLKRQEQVARERYYQSVFAYEETVLEALGDVEKSLLDIATYRSQAENYARLLRANIEIATMTNSLYRNGMSAYLDVIDAERNMYQSQMEYVNLVAQQYINYVNLFKALGGGW